MGKKKTNDTPINDGSKPLKDKQQETFCALYSTAGHYFFGNATYSYAEAYGKMDRLNEIDEKLETTNNVHEYDDDGDLIDDGPTNYQKLSAEKKGIMNTCSSNGWRLLRNADIRLRCNYYMNTYLSEKAIDARRAFLINQDKDLRASESALANWDKVQGRIKGKDGDKPDKVIVEFQWQDPEPRPDAKKPVTKIK